MKNRIIISLIMVVALPAFATSMAFAEETTVTAVSSEPAGTRVLQPLVAPSSLVFVTSTASTAFSASVVETLANGVNPWYVTLKSGDFTGSAGTISATNFSYTGSSTAVTLTGDLSGTIQPGTNGALNGAGQEMFRVINEVPGALPGYTGTYTGTGLLTLTLPAGTLAGTYTATITVTLVA